MPCLTDAGRRRPTAASHADAKFAVTRDETSGTYSNGATSLGAASTLNFASPYACNTAAVTPAQLIAGTDALGGIANVNLSGTAFAVAGNPCGGASSCTCSGTTNGLTCSGFVANIYGTSAAVVLYTPLTQSLILRADGACGWIYPSPSSTLLPLDGVVQLPQQQPACGGVPCGYAGSSCWAVGVARNGTIYAQTLWVGASGLTYIPLPQQLSPPFPAISAINAGVGNVAAPNTVSLSNVYYSKRPQLTAYSCVRVNLSAVGTAIIDTTDSSFAVTRDGELVSGSSEVFMLMYCSFSPHRRNRKRILDRPLVGGTCNH